MTLVRGIDTSLIRRAWNRSTSASPNEWTPESPARGQCAITALVVQDCIGGILIRTLACRPDGTEESHYANLCADDVVLDLTESQFPEGTTFGSWEERTREYVLSFPPTRERYNTLCRRLNELRTLDAMAAS